MKGPSTSQRVSQKPIQGITPCFFEHQGYKLALEVDQIGSARTRINEVSNQKAAKGRDAWSELNLIDGPASEIL